MSSYLQNGNVIICRKFSSLAALEVVTLTTSSAASDENFVMLSLSKLKQIYFTQRLNFYWDFSEVCSLGSNQEYSSIGSDNGLVPTRWKAIIWTNDV